MDHHDDPLLHLAGLGESVGVRVPLPRYGVLRLADQSVAW